MLSISRYDENQVSHEFLHSIPDICGILKGQKAIGNVQLVGKDTKLLGVLVVTFPVVQF